MRQLQRERMQRSVPGRDESTIVYGALPPKLFASVRRRFRAIHRRHSLHPDEEVWSTRRRHDWRHRDVSGS